jgi:hypothetical protein
VFKNTEERFTQMKVVLMYEENINKDVNAGVMRK